jgi:uncharacterized protein (TIGR02271 family)
MDSPMTMDQLTELRGSSVHSQDGEKIGSVEEVFYDADTHQPEWIGIGTGFFGMKRVLVPVQGASMSADGVVVPYSKQMVKDTPDVDGDEISEETERELYSYYGLQYSDSRSDTTLADSGPQMTDVDTTSTADVDTTTRSDFVDRGDASVTRSEEELAVGKREVTTGRLRVHKWVETEQVEAPVTLRQETVHVERQPINEVVTGAEIGEDSVDITLHGEEAIVDKRVVAKERISVDKDVVEETETVRDTVRKEHVEVDEGGVSGMTGTTGRSGTTGMVDSDLDRSRTGGDDRGFVDKAKDKLDPRS